MDVVNDDQWKQFWYPVAFADELGDGPQKRIVCGTHIVVWATGDGVAAAKDRCPHRDAALSQGWVSDGCLVCPYHGWEWRNDGSLRAVPQTPERSSFPAKYQLDHVECAVYSGAVWVCLDTSAGYSIPPVPDGGVEGWRHVREFDEVWATSPARLMENSVDPAHTTFVHKESFGYLADPVMPPPEVERTPWGLRMTNEVRVMNPEISRVSTGVSDDETVRRTTTEVYVPFLRVSSIDYPSGTRHRIVTAATPIDNEHLRLVQWAVRNDTEADAPASDVVAFDRQVTHEDKLLLEAITAPYDPDLQASVHVATDRASVELRRLYNGLITGEWAPVTGAVPATASSSA